MPWEGLDIILKDTSIIYAGGWDTVNEVEVEQIKKKRQ